MSCGHHRHVGQELYSTWTLGSSTVNIEQDILIRYWTCFVAKIHFTPVIFCTEFSKTSKSVFTVFSFSCTLLGLIHFMKDGVKRNDIASPMLIVHCLFQKLPWSLNSMNISMYLIVWQNICASSPPDWRELTFNAPKNNFHRMIPHYECIARTNFAYLFLWYMWCYLLDPLGCLNLIKLDTRCFFRTQNLNLCHNAPHRYRYLLPSFSVYIYIYI